MLVQLELLVPCNSCVLLCGSRTSHGAEHAGKFLLREGLLVLILLFRANPRPGKNLFDLFNLFIDLHIPPALRLC